MTVLRNISNKRYLALAFFCVLVSVIFMTLHEPVDAGTQKHRIAIAASRNIPEYNIALEGFLDVLTKQGIAYESASFDFKGQKEDTEKIIEEIRDFHPEIILTVGSAATSIIANNFEDTPVVFSMVLYPVASAFVSCMEKPGKNLTGAAMDVPIERQFTELSRIVPHLKRIGVLYSPKETTSIVETARKAAKAMGFELFAEVVNSESDVPEALNRLDDKKIDALWSVADGNVFTEPSTKYIIKYVVHRGLPFMGPHNVFVRAGALVALTADYKDNGRQAAEISIRILNGEKPMNIPVATPRKVDMTLNLQVANHIRLRIPQKIIDEASQTFD